MVQRLKRQGLISINQSPFDKTGNEAAIVLANQQRRAG
jgi:hypothetical protein